MHPQTPHNEPVATKIEKQQTSGSQVWVNTLRFRLPEPLPGQEATLQTLALGEEARCFQGSADLKDKAITKAQQA